MEIKGFTLVNEEKLHRAVYGTIGKGGQPFGGVGEDASEDRVLAEYDRLGGLVLKGKLKVKTGSFYDVKARKPREEPEVSFLTVLDSDIVEVTEDDALALEKMREKTKALKENSKAKNKIKSKTKSVKEVEEDEE